MKIFSIITACTLLAHPCLAANDYTIYLVRHAEKQTDSSNPALTLCGQQRAEQLATILDTANIKAIYSTNYQRMLATAAPLSNKKNIIISHYNPKKLAQFSLHLKQHQENSLIVGHSNTTAQLTQLLSSQDVKNLSEGDFQHLYQVQFIAGQSHLIQLTQPLSCQ